MATLEQLERRILELEKFVSEKRNQQISFPLDDKSRIVLSKYFMSFVRNLDFINVTGDSFRDILVTQDGKANLLSATMELVRYTAETNDEVTLGQDLVNLTPGRGFANDDQVVVYTTGTPPGGVTAGIIYYVISANGTGTVFKISATLGGASVNITSGGTGEQYIKRVD